MHLPIDDILTYTDTEVHRYIFGNNGDTEMIATRNDSYGNEKRTNERTNEQTNERTNERRNLT